MDNKTNNHFCIQPFLNIKTGYDGSYNVCCNSFTDTMNMLENSAEDFFTSEYVQNFKKLLLNGEKLKDCQRCHFQEEKHGNSFRTEYNKFYKIKNNQSIEYYKDIVNKFKFDRLTKPIHVEWYISNLCNLKCLTCDEGSSSQFHTENKLLNVTKNKQKDFTKIVVDSAKSLKSLIHPRLQFLNIRGGETLLVPQLKKILYDVHDNVAKKITLKIETNGTMMPDEIWLSIFKKFKKMLINVSVDGFQDDNHYLRFPSQWSKIMGTIEWFKKNNIEFSINTVVSNLNIMVLDKLLTWVQKENLYNYFYVLQEPKIYIPTNLPIECLKIASERLKSIKSSFRNTDTAHHVDKLIQMCNNEGQPNAELWTEFQKEINMRDKHRGNDIKKMLPELEPYFN